MKNYAGATWRNYAAGDYYQGDYYRRYAAGGLLGKIFGGIKGAVGGFIKGGPLGAIGGAAKGVLTSGSKSTAMVPVGAQVPTISFQVPPQFPGATKTPGIKGTIQRVLPGGATGYEAQAGMSGYHYAKDGSGRLVRNRRMNPANPRALRRAVRRQQSFVALARRVLKGTGMTIKRSGTGAKRRAPRR